jgi:protease-4
VWLLLLIGLGVVAAGALGRYTSASGDWSEKRIEGKGEQKVVVVRVSGDITGSAGGGALSAVTASSRAIVSQLRQADADADVAAVILRLETPGGEVVASDEIYREVRRVGAHKPIVSSMGDVAASGGYYIAAATKRIIANPSTWTGSIGVIAILPNVEQLSQKIGVKPVVLKSGAFKDAGSPFRDLRPEEQAYFQKLIEEAYETFLKAVSDGRGKPADEIRPLADGRVYSGKQALANGLVDELGDLDAAYAAARRLAKLDRSAASLVEYQRQGSIFDLFGPAFRSPIDQAREEIGLKPGLQYRFLAGT